MEVMKKVKSDNHKYFLNKGMVNSNLNNKKKEIKKNVVGNFQLNKSVQKKQKTQDLKGYTEREKKLRL